MVIRTQPVGEYDRRVVLLTREMGRISAFAKSARRPNSALVAAANLFCFGTFRMYAGRDSYTIVEATIQNFFPFFRTHVEEALYGEYFCEVAEDITRENNDEAMLLLLLYQSLRALEAGRIPARLVRSIFEIKCIVVEGEFPGIPARNPYPPAVTHALQVIERAPVAGLYTFTLDEPYRNELAGIADHLMDRTFHLHFKSLDVLETMTGGS